MRTGVRISNLLRPLFKHGFKSLRQRSLFAFSTVMDPFKTLGASNTDEFKIIKKKYLKLVNKYHPDKNDGSEVPYFKRIKRLSDNSLFNKYDKIIPLKQDMSNSSYSWT